MGADRGLGPLMSCRALVRIPLDQFQYATPDDRCHSETTTQPPTPCVSAAALAGRIQTTIRQAVVLAICQVAHIGADGLSGRSKFWRSHYVAIGMLYKPESRWPRRHHRRPAMCRGGQDRGSACRLAVSVKGQIRGVKVGSVRKPKGGCADEGLR